VFATKHLSINSTATRKSIAFLGKVPTVVNGNSSEEAPKEVLIVSQVLFSGGRPEGSKHNPKFQSAMWHHFKHFQSKNFFPCCLSFTALELFCHNYMENR
jgi:hypothetical protein